MTGSIRTILCVLLSVRAASVLAFHPEDFTSDAPLQCVVCNASYYCKNGERYACPGDSTAILYADILEECICNPGYFARRIPAQLTYDFYSPLYPACRHCPNDAQFPFPQYAFDGTIRLKLWLDYAASIGATTNINAIGSRSGNPDNFGFTGVYANNVATPANDLFFRLKLSSEYQTVTVIYRSFNQWIHLYINDVLQQSCGIQQTPWVDTKQECSYTTTYLPGSLLEFRGTYYNYIGENLKFVFSNLVVTPYSCNLGLSPHWYLYGQRNSCPATKVVAAHGSSSAEDCFCPPGWYSQANRSSPCLPCPPGTFADQHNMSQCMLCPANSWHDKTNQTNISACLCNAGWVGVAANGCVECAAGTYETAPGTSILDCRVCKLCNTTTNAAFTDHYDAAREGLGCGVSSVEVCTACPSLSSLFRPTTQTQSNFGVRSCVCDENSYGLIGTACTACPVGQNRTGFIYENTTLHNCQCLPGYEPDPALPNLCKQCPINMFKAVGGDINCTACPAGYVTDGRTGQTYCVCTMGTEQLSAEPVCETCRDGRFKNASIDKYANRECLNCSKFCSDCNQVIYDFSKVALGQPWKDYAAAIGIPCFTMFSWGDCGGGYMGQWNNGAWMTGTMPAGYNFVEVTFYAACAGNVVLSIDGVSKAISYGNTVVYQQKYSAGQILRLQEFSPDQQGGIGKNLKISFSTCNEIYVSSQTGIERYVTQECYNSSDVLCTLCQTCKPGFYDNQTCGLNHGNDRLDTVCLPCFPDFYCLGAKNPATKCKVCNTSTNAAFTDHYDAARGGLGCGEASVEVCTQCPSASSLFLPTNEIQRNFGVRSCVCDKDFYGVVGTACAACPAGQVRPDFINSNTTLVDCLCAPGFEPDPAAANLCRQCPIGWYKPSVGDHNCTVCPVTFTTEKTGNHNASACVCQPGYALSTEQVCVICPENTHKEGFNINTTCNACTANSFGAAGGTGPLECSCSANHEANPLLCAPCKPGNYKNESTKIGLSNELFVASQIINLARACRAGDCPVTTNADYDTGPWGYPARNVNDGNLNTIHHTVGAPTWTIIDLQQTVFVTRIRIYNRFAPDCCANKLKDFNLRLGNSPTFLNNPACALNQANFENFRDFTCILSGRYFSIDQPNPYLHLREIEIYGTKHNYAYESANEWQADLVSTVLGRCTLCPQNTVTNNTGVLACEACAAGKTTDGRLGQVECVCDIGTEPDTDGLCQTCRAGTYKDTSTDKYANRACVNCSSCAAGQQVNTECNVTHRITCRACQANSWSAAGRTLLEPCLCNAGYELQGQLCVACPVGKARAVNNNNSIVCETCNSTTFTSVTASATCGACSPVCAELCPQVIYDFSQVALGQPWKDYAAAIGFPSQAMFGWGNCGGSEWMGVWNNAAYVQGTMPAGYKFVEVTFYFVNCQGGSVGLSIDGVTKAISYGNLVVYQQQYSPGQTLRIQEFSSDQQGGIGKNLKIRFYNPCISLYVKNECNASRDVICQECKTCGSGLYSSNKCGNDYGNDRLDTECSGCPAGFYCLGGSVTQSAIPCPGCPANQQVATLCSGMHNGTCKACQANSWTPAGRTEFGPCLCDAGYELQGDQCVACPVGKARQANYNNSIMCETCGAGTLTLVSTTIVCGTCTSMCEGVPGRYFVKHECNATRDVICQECQTCTPGFYANNTCGPHYGNDRLDTQCLPCPAGSYCPLGYEPPIPCPDNGKSPPGSISEKACDCDAGTFRDVDGCALCPFDYYCPGKQIQHAISCPRDSRTASRGSTLRLDCHCHTGFFRDPPESLSSFNCSLCLPGDFCFNNSAYNCSDALMVSAPGSGFFDNCTCISGYYNNATVCEDCPANYYCEGGKRLPCPANEWTAYEGRSSECVCMPGFYRDQGVCVSCTDDYFCEGLDDSRQACPQHSTGRGASEIEHCLCNPGFEAVYSTNASEPHACRACEHGGGTYKYKSGLGNRACSQCTECLPHLHSTWTQIACTPTADALCDYCSVCFNETKDATRLLYTTHACQQFFDTRCANCTACDRDSEWEFMPCSESGDRQCSRIAQDRTCPAGFYAGGHTSTTDSKCLPCAVRNTPYEGEWLHHFTSAGRRYDDPFSCELTCRAFSRLANGTDPSFGCTTCETGNVLFKEFTQNLLECQFECLPGYARRGEDCVLDTFHADAQIYWNHSVNVTHVRREAMRDHSGRSAFQLTVSHTAHGTFAVVVGKSEPTCAGRAAVLLRREASAACCFSELWRVSTTSQLGLPSTAREQCSRPGPPWSELLSDTQLVFEVPDTRIEELANCSQFEDGLACDLYVSIVDTLLLHHFSVPVRLELRRAAALSAVGAQTYVPLSGFRVEAQLAYVELDGSPVFVVVSDMAPLPGAGATDVALHSAGLRLALPPPEVNCERYGTLLAGGASLNVSAEAWTLGAAPVRAVTFLRAPQGTQFLKLFYTLRLREREGAIGTKNQMHVAVWRNLSQVRAVCDLPPPSLSVTGGEVLSCSGLGETAVAAATALHSPAETVRGEVGGLTSFVARALHPHIRSVLVKNMLVAFTLPAADPIVADTNVTSMHLGHLDFTDAFKDACQTTEFCHFRYVHQGGGMHFLPSCDATAQDAARAWLRSALGVLEDDGHVQALCRLAHRQSAREYAFLVALVNTRAYLPRGGQWHDLQNHSAPLSTSRVAALFEFV